MNVVISTYLTGSPDPQRGSHWPADYNAVQRLIDSLAKHRVNLVLINDCFDMPDTELVKHIRVPAGGNPYFYRWQVIMDYLQVQTGLEKIWCVDSTDVEMLRDPFPHMTDRLHVGDEPQQLDIPFMHRGVTADWMKRFIAENADKPLLNCGILGGHYCYVRACIAAVLALYKDDPVAIGPYEMGAFNYVIRTFFDGRFTHGEPVNTRFRAMDMDNDVCWWRHK